MDLSEFIVNAMKYIDRELDEVNPDSVNRSKVRGKINVLIVSQANELIVLSRNERQKAIDSIYRRCLSQELFKNKGE